MQHEVSEFIVIAPAGMGKAIEWAEPQLRSYLAGHFPLYSFRIEPYGPFADEENFAVIPIMNRQAPPNERPADPDALVMCSLDPSIIPEIRHILKLYDPTVTMIN